MFELWYSQCPLNVGAGLEVFGQTDPGESWPNPSSGIMYAVRMCFLSGVRQGVGDLSGQVLSLSGLFCPLSYHTVQPCVNRV